MTPDWNAVRLDLLEIDEPMRAALRQMRPFFAKTLPGILKRFYDKVRHYDPACAARPKRGISISPSTAFISCSAMNISRQPTYHCGATPAR